MHIKKINKNKIQFTLDRDDLIERHISLPELAYGSEKAYDLFEEILESAAENFDFYVEEDSVMIEAIPLPDGRLLLTVTRIEEPDELDTRFSKFSPREGEMDSSFEPLDTHSLPPQGADAFLDLFKNQPESLSEEDGDNTAKTISSKQKNSLACVYIFDQLNTLIDAAHILSNNYHGMNSLYKDEATNTYYLIITKTYHSAGEFNKFCNILSEYGTLIQYHMPTEAFFNEHYSCIVKNVALQRLDKF